jgi:hypothetical protein
MLNCHCRDCQQMSGGPYTPVVYVPAKAFRITKGRRFDQYRPTRSGSLPDRAAMS